MMIDKSALEALEIFSFEDHPNRHFSDRKDGFSIFRASEISFSLYINFKIRIDESNKIKWGREAVEKLVHAPIAKN